MSTEMSELSLRTAGTATVSRALRTMEPLITQRASFARITKASVGIRMIVPALAVFAMCRHQWPMTASRALLMTTMPTRVLKIFARTATVSALVPMIVLGWAAIAT